jgi:Protein of unknown function (DUF3767)
MAACNSRQGLTSVVAEFSLIARGLNNPKTPNPKFPRAVGEHPVSWPGFKFRSFPFDRPITSVLKQHPATLSHPTQPNPHPHNMADDTRKAGTPSSDEAQYSPREPEEPHYVAPETPRPRRKKPMHAYPETQAGKMWKALQPDEPVNTMPGGTVNTAGGRPKEVTWRDAFNFGGSIGDIAKIPWMPCSRDALLVGIGAGGALGGTSFVLTGTHCPAHCLDKLTGDKI